MKKTAQIVAIPLNKSGKLAKKDTSDKYELAEGETVFVNGFGYTPQQLLVLSNDGIFPKDNLYGDGKLVVANNEWSGETNIEWKKVIASYPQIEGTLPISKETVQEWIDAGTPEECSVDKHEWSTVLNDSITIKHLVKNNWKLVKSELPKPPFDDALMYYYERNTLDPQGNLLLEFPEQQTIEDIRSGYLSVEWIKPSIPTDEKINDIASDYAVEKCRIMKNMKCLTARKTAYIDGYRQALKDLGHE